MPNHYYSSLASGLDDGTNWTNAFETFTTALASKGATDVIWVDDDSDDVHIADLTLTFPDTPGLKMICVESDGRTTESPTAGRKTARKRGTGTGIQITIAGRAYVFGVSFETDGGGNNCDIVIGTVPGDHNLVFECCKFQLNGNGGGTDYSIGRAGNNSAVDMLFRFISCELTFGAAAQTIFIQNGRVEFNGLTLAGVAPTTIFTPNVGETLCLHVESSDLSGVSFTNLIDVSVENPGLARFLNCKLPAGINSTTGTIPGPGCIRTELFNCSDGNRNYEVYIQDWSGHCEDENVIVLNANDGDDDYSVKIVTTANASFEHPFKTPWFGQRQVDVGTSVDIEVEIQYANASAVQLKNNQVWLEVEVLSTTGFPVGGKVSSRVADFVTAATAYGLSSAVWEGSLADPVKQTISVSVIPRVKGWLHARLCVAEPEETIYLNNELTVT